MIGDCKFNRNQGSCSNSVGVSIKEYIFPVNCHVMSKMHDFGRRWRFGSFNLSGHKHEIVPAMCNYVGVRTATRVWNHTVHTHISCTIDWLEMHSVIFKTPPTKYFTMNIITSPTNIQTAQEQINSYLVGIPIPPHPREPRFGLLPRDLHQLRGQGWHGMVNFHQFPRDGRVDNRWS